MRRIARAMAVAAVSAAVGLVLVTGALAKKSSTVKVVNKSNWSIDKMYLSPVDENEWGPDQLGDAIIKTGDNFTLKEIPCDSWDVKLVDEDGDECVVHGVDLCKSSEVWEITTKDLLKCQAVTDE